MRTVLGITLGLLLGLVCLTNNASAMEHVYAPASLDSVPDTGLREELQVVAPNYDVLDRASQVDVYARVWSMYNQTHNQFIGDGYYADRHRQRHDTTDLGFVPGTAFDPYRRYYHDGRHNGFSSPYRGEDSHFGGRDYDRQYEQPGYRHSGSILGGPIYGDHWRHGNRR